MTAHLPFSLARIDAMIEAIGPLNFSQDPLNGADELHYAPDMAEVVSEMVKVYTASAWVPRQIRTSPKTTLPSGHVVGLRQPDGQAGPYADVVLVVTPQGSEPVDAVPRGNVETLDPLQPVELGA